MPTPIMARATMKPGRPSETANNAQPAAASTPIAVCTRRGPYTSSNTPIGNCHRQYARNSTDASSPNSLADSPYSIASTGPITAITPRAAWLTKFSPASGRVTRRKVARTLALAHDGEGRIKAGGGAGKEDGQSQGDVP